MQDRSRRATGTGHSVPVEASDHVTLPAGWGVGYPEDREKAVRVRPSQQVDAPTTFHPLVPAPHEDDPLGIYRSVGVPDRHAHVPSQHDESERPAGTALPVKQPVHASAEKSYGGAEQVRKVAGTTRVSSRRLGLRGHEVIAGAGASALATIVTSSLGIGGTPFGSAMTSMVIAVAGAIFARLLTRDRGADAGETTAQPGQRASAPARGRSRGVFLRTVGIAVALTLGTGILGAIFLSGATGIPFSQQVLNITSSSYRVREMWEQAWPYLKQAWRAAVR